MFEINTTDLENSVIGLMKEYGVEDSMLNRQQCLEIAELQGVTGLTDALEVAKKAGKLTGSCIENCIDILNVSGGAGDCKAGETGVGSMGLRLQLRGDAGKNVVEAAIVKNMQQAQVVTAIIGTAETDGRIVIEQTTGFCKAKGGWIT